MRIDFDERAIEDGIDEGRNSMGALFKGRRGDGSIHSSLLLGLGASKRRVAQPRAAIAHIIRGMSSSKQQASSPAVDVTTDHKAAVDVLISYHQQTKHSFKKYARGPKGLDWASQPNPFRRYAGAKVVCLDHFEISSDADPAEEEALYPFLFSGKAEPQKLTKSSLSQLLFDSLSLSAWKKAGTSTWSLRVNPSSGNLHPTEGYVISGALQGVSETPFVAHYAPKEHALEVRAQLPAELWNELSQGLPEGAFLVGLSSIFWREAWKYGERAFRYCNHDVGHAIGAVAVAGANLGWNAVLLDCYGTNELSHLLGLACGDSKADVEAFQTSTSDSVKGIFRSLEREHADCILAVFPWSRELPSYEELRIVAPELLLGYLSNVEFLGHQNALSKDHVRWGRIYEAGIASHKPSSSSKLRVSHYGSSPVPESFLGATHYQPFTVRHVVRKRRSAVDMDGQYGMQKEAFYQILLKASVGVPGMFPFGVLPWMPEVHMAIFVHRVVGLPQGLYFMVRNQGHEQELKAGLSKQFVWEKPPECPPELCLYRLVSGDSRVLAARISCNQEIAGNSFFSLGMIARFESVLKERGPWMYPRLFWEAGLLGQVLYLEATAIGVAATGIGCYFDDAVHEVLGLENKEFQSLYHFTIGVPTLDRRMLTLPAYPGPAVDA